MSGSIRGITPEENARLPGPAVDLPVVPLPPVAPEAEPQVIEIAPQEQAPAAAPAPESAPAAADTPEPEPEADAAVGEAAAEGEDTAPAAAVDAPSAEEAAPDAEPPAEEEDPNAGISFRQGPRGMLIGTTNDVIPVNGFTTFLRRLGRVKPNAGPRIAAQDFVRVEGRQIEVRAATEQETQEFADLLGRPGRDLSVISTRGQYMPTDVQEFVEAVRAANETRFEELRRRVQTRDQQIRMAEKLGLDGAVDRLLTRRVGETLNNEELIAGAVSLVNIKRETDEAAAALLSAAPGSPDEAAALRRFGLNHALTAAVAGQLNGATAEAGRALGALRFAGDALRGVPQEQMGAQAQRLGVQGQAGPMGLRVPDTEQSIIEALGGAEVLRNQAALWAALPTPAARTRFAQRSFAARSAEALSSAYVSSLLWLPTTHLKNILGNTTMGMWQVPERFLAGAIGAVRTRLPGANDERVFMGEGLAQLFGMWQGLGDGLRASRDVFRSGVGQNGMGKVEMPRVNPLSAEALQVSGVMGQAVDMLGTAMGIGGRALLSEDAFFQTIATRMELNAQAVRTRNNLVRDGMAPRQAAAEAARLMEDPPEMWREAAETSARAMTFQQEMTGILGQLDTVMQHPLAKLWVPFFRTPTNVARAVLNRTPLPFAINGQLWADIRAGGATADMALARVALGSTMMWWFAGLAQDAAGSADFRITGGEPGQPALRENFRRQGLQAYSICHKGAQGWSCQSYAGVGDPLSGLLGMAAQMGNLVASHPGGTEDVGMDDLAMAAASGLYGYMLEQPFLTGISDFANAVIGQPNASAEARAKRAMEALTRQAATAVLSPLTGGTLAAGVERVIDPTTRNTMPTDREEAQFGPVASGFFEAWRRAQSRIPGASSDADPLLNVWGEPVQPTEGGAWELFWPIRTTREGTADTLETELYRLGGVIQRPASKFPQTDIRLTSGQYNFLVRHMNEADSSGMTMREEMAAVVSAPDWAVMDVADQKQRLQRIRSLRFQAAQRALLDTDFDLNRRVQRDREFRRAFGRPAPEE